MASKSILHNSLSEGIRQAFNIIYGDHGILEIINGYPPTFHFSVLDILIFPLISSAMISYGVPTKEIGGGRVAWDEERQTNFRYAVVAVGFMLEVPRLVLAVSATICLSPIVTLFHVLKYPYVRYVENNRYVENQFYQLNVTDDNNKDSLGQCVRQDDVTLNQLGLVFDREACRLAFESNVGRSSLGFFLAGSNQTAASQAGAEVRIEGAL